MKIEERVKALEKAKEQKEREIKQATIFIWGIVVGVIFCALMVIIEVYL